MVNIKELPRFFWLLVMGVLWVILCVALELTVYSCTPSETKAMQTAHDATCLPVLSHDAAFAAFVERYGVDPAVIAAELCELPTVAIEVARRIEDESR